MMRGSGIVNIGTGVDLLFDLSLSFSLFLFGVLNPDVTRAASFRSGDIEWLSVETDNDSEVDIDVDCDSGRDEVVVRDRTEPDSLGSGSGGRLSASISRSVRDIRSRIDFHRAESSVCRRNTSPFLKSRLPMVLSIDAIA